MNDGNIELLANTGQGCNPISINQVASFSRLGVDFPLFADLSKLIH